MAYTCIVLLYQILCIYMLQHFVIPSFPRGKLDTRHLLLSVAFARQDKARQNRDGSKETKEQRDMEKNRPCQAMPRHAMPQGLGLVDASCSASPLLAVWPVWPIGVAHKISVSRFSLLYVAFHKPRAQRVRDIQYLNSTSNRTPHYYLHCCNQTTTRD